MNKIREGKAELRWVKNNSYWSSKKKIIFSFVNLFFLHRDQFCGELTEIEIEELIK